MNNQENKQNEINPNQNQQQNKQSNQQATRNPNENFGSSSENR